MLDVIQIAHKYLLNGVVEHCQQSLNDWTKDCKPGTGNRSKDEASVNCLLRIITLSNRLQINGFLRNAVGMLAKYNPPLYVDYDDDDDYSFDDYSFGGNRELKERYAALPIEVKYDILLGRLQLVDDNKVRP